MDRSCDAVGQAIRKCPFLHKVSGEQGEQYARQIATRPAVPASTGRPQPIFEERSCDFEATLKLFHGASGIVPLARFSNSEAQQANRQSQLTHMEASSSSANRRQQHPVLHAPFAAMSMSGAFSFLVSEDFCCSLPADCITTCAPLAVTTTLLFAHMAIVCAAWTT